MTLGEALQKRTAKSTSEKIREAKNALKRDSTFGNMTTFPIWAGLHGELVS